RPQLLRQPRGGALQAPRVGKEQIERQPQIAVPARLIDEVSISTEPGGIDSVEQSGPAKVIEPLSHHAPSKPRSRGSRRIRSPFPPRGYAVAVTPSGVSLGT